MHIELEFLEGGKRVHSNLLESPDFIPVPVPGDRVIFNGRAYVIERRDFCYMEQPGNGAALINDRSVRISMVCRLVDVPIPAETDAGKHAPV